MKVQALIILFVVQVSSMTTKEPIENERFRFRYDPQSMILMAINHHKCYLYATSGSESTDVHTTTGLHLLELKIITLIDDDTATYTSITHDALKAESKVLGHVCHNPNNTIYQLTVPNS
ncbi:uncharacterized protein [Mytilus edulis]|uniref:uncharacterized protein n=1 Tax=Mytilus edulis TaxID=6550 RepID=UPI0039F13FF4